MVLHKLNDSQLVSEYIQGSENALGTLIERHNQRIFSFIFSKVYDKEISNDILMPKFNDNGEFSIFSVLSDDALNAETKIIKSQVETDVRSLVDELPDDQREVLLMRMYNDMSFKEISENTGVSINTALGRMRKKSICCCNKAVIFALSYI